jgi:hypothetical protein
MYIFLDGIRINVEVIPNSFESFMDRHSVYVNPETEDDGRAAEEIAGWSREGPWTISSFEIYPDEYDGEPVHYNHYGGIYDKTSVYGCFVTTNDTSRFAQVSYWRRNKNGNMTTPSNKSFTPNFPLSTISINVGDWVLITNVNKGNVGTLRRRVFDIRKIIEERGVTKYVVEDSYGTYKLMPNEFIKYNPYSYNITDIVFDKKTKKQISVNKTNISKIKSNPLNYRVVYSAQLHPKKFLRNSYVTLDSSCLPPLELFQNENYYVVIAGYANSYEDGSNIGWIVLTHPEWGVNFAVPLEYVTSSNLSGTSFFLTDDQYQFVRNDIKMRKLRSTTPNELKYYTRTDTNSKVLVQKNRSDKKKHKEEIKYKSHPRRSRRYISPPTGKKVFGYTFLVEEKLVPELVKTMTQGGLRQTELKETGQKAFVTKRTLINQNHKTIKR